MPLLKTPRVALKWRVALLAAAATASLAGLTMVVAYEVVRGGLYAEVRRALKSDAAVVANLYNSGEGSASTTLSGPTGGVVLQVYDPSGHLLVASRPEFERAEMALPAADVISGMGVPTSWSGTIGGKKMEAALAPFELGVVAVLTDPSYIGALLTDLSRNLLVAAVLLVVVSLLVGYAVAAASLRPLTRLARLASTLGPERLDVIEYDGPRDEIGRLTAALNGLVGRLREALDSQRVFFAETSHELRTPLTSLRGFLDRAVRRTTPEARDDLMDAQRVAGSMARLVEDLLQLSRGELIVDPNPHLVELRSDVLVHVADEFPGVAVTGGLPALVLGDPQRLMQLVRNLTANAVRAASGPEGVVLGLEVLGAEAVVSVTDDGPGIAPESLERIFEKFYKGPGGGSGLGLAIARQVAERHHGSIEVSSRPGATVFRVRLPLADADEDD
ncbi:MAG: HAMP domain-containing sensor histidine kinase [Trueperaceae bacterium]|nr:HAMP domain-containing sensor histidine kinase [Truepera sp.]HRN18400.1 HAMP domain-containing sensor histidine kinase [Trueperaceae bacterium]HRQ09952.1 HAMP domain-containing sensor histidine kinase [Trueperaceae bacterium]